MTKGTDAKMKALTRALFVLFALAMFSGEALAADAKIKFLVTPGAGVRAFSKGDAHFAGFAEYPLTKVGVEGRYEVYTGEIFSDSSGPSEPDKKFHYVAGGGASGYLKTAQAVYLGASETARTITLDVDKLDDSHREDNGFRADNVYLNVNDAQHIVLEPGETFRLIPIRTWQAMEGFTENYFIEPDYSYEILGELDETGVLSCEKEGKPGLEYAEIKGLKPGVAVVRVTYDPIKLFYEDYGGIYFNAIELANTGIVVVTVKDGAKDSGITTNIGAREYDTIYFDKAKTDHAEYSFKPSGTGDISVRVHRPIHAGGSAWGQGWSDGARNADGSFTVNLYEGRNIVEIGASGAAFNEYHVINAKGLGIKVSGEIRAGGSVKITFDGIRTPLEKIAGIYNPGFPDTCYVRYETANGGEARSEGVQYNLSANNAITLTVPESGRVQLTGGVIKCGHLGDQLGSHRTRPGREPVYPNLNARGYEGEYCSLPDILLSASGEGDKSDAGGSGGGGCDAGTVSAFALLAVAIGGALVRFTLQAFDFKLFNIGGGTRWRNDG